jgi:hypothetical protein
VFAGIVDQKNRVKNLGRLMGVHGRADFGNPSEIPIDELAKPAIVIHGSRSRSSTDVKFEIRDAEGVLYIDQEKGYAQKIFFRWPDFLLSGPDLGLYSAFLIWDPPYGRNPGWVKKRGDGEFIIAHRLGLSLAGGVLKAGRSLPDLLILWQKHLFVSTWRHSVSGGG